ncbi:MAG TPA: 2-C-methyl-D-erythritol 4-phosphate cytidylyltransferase [Dehalococcoidia bacterium]
MTAAGREQVGAIIVAAGRSARMEGVDKLFAPLGGRPLLARTLAAFPEAEVDRLVLVLREENLERGRALLAELPPGLPATAVPGGERRQDSVWAGLQALGPCAWVVVHDGARPLVEPELIRRGLAAAQATHAAVAAVPVVDTIKEVDEGGLVRRTLDRTRLWAVQTPQVFRRELLERAHREVTAEVTDDAAMVELLGHPVTVYRGSYRNLKVTTPADLAAAEALLRASQSS